MSDMYILDGRQPVPATAEEWGRWFQTADRTVRKTEIHHPTRGMIEVSTVFLGLDHGWDGRVQLYESMTFGDGVTDENQVQIRYATWDEAEAGHAKVCRAVAAGERVE